jgi:CRISPR system Cascade subunit CasE
MPPDLFMVRLRFDLGRLYELARRRRLPVRESDLGYVVHCALKELFGAGAPGPFAIEGAEGRHAGVLAYSSRGADALRMHASAFADPLIHKTCDLEGLASKRMPSVWEEGTQLGFRVRACPIVRMSSDGPRWKRGAEVDAFLARCWREEGKQVDRAEVYSAWLAAELGRRGARLVRSELKAFQRQKLVRRDHATERRSHVVERPEVVIEGALEVQSDEGFSGLLARGVGRHRSFGFGMLLLRPA